jgi:hypothetical protein
LHKLHPVYLKTLNSLLIEKPLKKINSSTSKNKQKSVRVEKKFELKQIKKIIVDKGKQTQSALMLKFKGTPLNEKDLQIVAKKTIKI